MKIYNAETKQIVESDDLQEWVDCFQLIEMGQDEKTIKYYFKPKWEKVEGEKELLENILKCLNSVALKNVVDIENIGRTPKDCNILEFRVELETTTIRSCLRYSALTNAIFADVWRIKDNDLEKALKRYLEYKRGKCEVFN